MRLCWWPSLFSNPGFRLGLILALVGAAGWTFTAAGRVIAAPPTATPSAVGAGEVGTEGGLPAEYGAEGAMLHLLGSQLREAILRGKIDRHLIAAAEWALDRHRARAIRCIAAGLQTADGLCGPLEQLIGACRSAPSHGGNGAPSRAELRRFLRVVQAVAGEELQAEIKRLLREWDASASPERGSRTASLLHSRPR